MMPRALSVHFLPDLVLKDDLAGSVAVVVDVIRATTTIIHALAAGCVSVRPCLEIEEAHRLAHSLPPGSTLLGGERLGERIPGFDLGNSPGEYTSAVCRGKTLIITTTNGTRAVQHAAAADRVLIGAFVNLSAVARALRLDSRPIHVLCAGSDGEIDLEDTLFAGALVDVLSDFALNDSAKIARDVYRQRQHDLLASLGQSKGGDGIVRLGYDDDIQSAAQVDVFTLVPELQRNPLRIT
jgi:2-phosphosulfolactate phosphatase